MDREVKSNIIGVLLMLLFIYISDDTVEFGTNTVTEFISVKYGFVMVMAIVLNVYAIIKNSLISKKALLIIAVMMTCIFSTMIVNTDFQLGYFYKICLILYAYGLTQMYPLKTFAILFNQTIFLLTTISLFGYILAYLVPNVFSIFPTLTNSAGTTFYNMFLFVLPQTINNGIVRNFGIFREPGVFQIYIIMALLLKIHVIKDNSLLEYIVFILGIITTLSTTGYIALLFVLPMIIRNNILGKYKKHFMILFLLIGFILLSSFTNIFSLAEENQYVSVFGKLQNVKRYTTIARFASITENIRIASENPFFGIGLVQLAEQFPLYTLRQYDYLSIHNTNTFLIQFAAHGFIYGSLYLYMFWKLAKWISNEKAVMVFLTMAVVFAGENLTFSGFFVLLLMYGIISCGGHCGAPKEENCGD